MKYKIIERKSYNIGDEVIKSVFYVKYKTKYLFWKTIIDGYSECTKFFESIDEAEDYLYGLPFKWLEIKVKEIL